MRGRPKGAKDLKQRKLRNDISKLEDSRLLTVKDVRCFCLYIFLAIFLMVIAGGMFTCLINSSIGTVKQQSISDFVLILGDVIWVALALIGSITSFCVAFDNLSD